jgi:hypothetical protein
MRMGNLLMRDSVDMRMNDTATLGLDHPTVVPSNYGGDEDAPSTPRRSDDTGD